MNCAGVPEKQQILLGQILHFIAGSKGLSGVQVTDTQVRVIQSLDNKSIDFAFSDLDDVLFRTDTSGDDFIQINFTSGKKILLTETLIGFKPVALKGIDVSRLPKVVTTPDILSVFEAIQDSLQAPETDPHEILILKRIFEAVLAGGELIGFDLGLERSWIRRIPTHLSRTAA